MTVHLTADAILEEKGVRPLFVFLPPSSDKAILSALTVESLSQNISVSKCVKSVRVDAMGSPFLLIRGEEIPGLRCSTWYDGGSGLFQSAFLRTPPSRNPSACPVLICFLAFVLVYRTGGQSESNLKCIEDLFQKNGLYRSWRQCIMPQLSPNRGNHTKVSYYLLWAIISAYSSGLSLNPWRRHAISHTPVSSQ